MQKKTATQKRIEIAFKKGLPKYLRIYDNGGETLDRYTIVFTGRYKGRPRFGCEYISASQTGAGVYMHDEHTTQIDRPGYSHLGKPVKFETLDFELRYKILQDYMLTWGIQGIPVIHKGGYITIKQPGLPSDLCNIVYSTSDARGYKQSKQTNICYHIDTWGAIIKLIDEAYKSRERLVFDFGYMEGKEAGKSWGEVNDIKGYIGRSTGAIQIPLLIHNARSIGGGGLMTNCIVKITTSKGGHKYFQHPKYSAHETTE